MPTHCLIMPVSSPRCVISSQVFPLAPHRLWASPPPRDSALLCICCPKQLMGWSPAMPGDAHCTSSQHLCHPTLEAYLFLPYVGALGYLLDSSSTASKSNLKPTHPPHDMC